MTARTTASILLGLLAIVGPAVGQGDPEPILVPEPLKEFYYSGLAPERLAYAVDLWHDAVLKNDDNLVARSERQLLELLRHDLDSTGQVLEQFRLLVWRAQADSHVRSDSGESLSDDLPLLETLDREYYSHASDIHKAKARLIEAFCRSTAFSNKYRLISDYIEVLRRQIGLPKLKLAGGRSGDSVTSDETPTDVRVGAVLPSSGH